MSHNDKYKTLLIDSDPLIYRAGFAVEQATEWAGDLWTWYARTGDGTQYLEDLLRRLQYQFPNAKMLFFLSDPNANFRKAFYPEYKAGRARKPLLYRALRKWFKEEHNALQMRELEADDLISLYMTDPVHIGEPNLIVSIDKDLKTIPGHRMDMGAWHKDGTVEIEINAEVEADYFFMTQVLTGDRVDNFPGCPGVGPAGAAKILGDGTSYEDWWPKVVAAYEKKGLNEHAALLNARCARLLRDGEYDYGTHSVSLWEPPVIHDETS